MLVVLDFSIIMNMGRGLDERRNHEFANTAFTQLADWHRGSAIRYNWQSLLLTSDHAPANICYVLEAKDLCETHCSLCVGGEGSKGKSQIKLRSRSKDSQKCLAGVRTA